LVVLAVVSEKWLQILQISQHEEMILIGELLGGFFCNSF
jgi:hypothetical protein